MESRLQKMNPKTLDDLQDFAYTLGEHCQDFDNHIQYKSFVEGLIGELVSTLKKEELESVRKHVDLLATKRAKEEKTGNVSHFLEAKKEGSDSDDDDGMGVYDDFM